MAYLEHVPALRLGAQVTARDQTLTMVREAQNNLLASGVAWTPQVMVVRAREILSRGAPGQDEWTTVTMACALLLTALETSAVTTKERRTHHRRQRHELVKLDRRRWIDNGNGHSPDYDRRKHE